MEISKELGLIEIKLNRGEKLSKDERNKWNIRRQILENQELSRDNKFSLMLDLLFAEDSIRSQYEERYEQNKYDQVVAQVYGETLEQCVDERGISGLSDEGWRDLVIATINANCAGIEKVAKRICEFVKNIKDKFLR